MFRITLIAALAFTGVAHADSEPCELPEVRSVIPAAGSTDIPIDSRVVVELSGDLSCGEPDLRLYAQGATVDVDVLKWNQGDTTFVALQPANMLAADVDYTLEVAQPAQPGMGSTFHFATGTAFTNPPDQAPKVRILSAAFDPDREASENLYRIEAEVAGEGIPGALALGHLAIEQGGAPTNEGAFAATTRLDADGWTTTITFDAAAPVADKICVVLRQQDGAGNWSRPGRDCADTDAEHGLFGDERKERLLDGCSTVPGRNSAPFALFALLPLGLLLRRRR